MRTLLAGLLVVVGTGAAEAQIRPLGTPLMPLGASAPSAAQRTPTARIAPLAPMGANDLPANIQPQSAMRAQAASAVPVPQQTVPGVVTDPALAAATPATTHRAAKADPSAMRSLAPDAPVRSAMPQATAAAPR